MNLAASHSGRWRRGWGGGGGGERKGDVSEEERRSNLTFFGDLTKFSAAAVMVWSFHPGGARKKVGIREYMYPHSSGHCSCTPLGKILDSLLMKGNVLENGRRTNVVPILKRGEN